ncbi:ISL3 family transposase, partial [Vibrio sp. 1180_3]|nr:ISL3 family transposase [Vibrio sp. 1180_3]
QIKAVAMDMGDSYIKAVTEHLPNADIVFDRFHVMQLYSKIIRKERSFEFKKAENHKDKKLIKGSLFLLLKNAGKLSSSQSDKLDELLESNKHLCFIYMMKEQLQQIWNSTNYLEMEHKLEQWCHLAMQSGILSLQSFVGTLQRHKKGSVTTQLTI